MRPLKKNLYDIVAATLYIKGAVKHYGTVRITINCTAAQERDLESLLTNSYAFLPLELKLALAEDSYNDPDQIRIHVASMLLGLVVSLILRNPSQELRSLTRRVYFG